MLMQFLGNMSQSWMLTSFAARTITFLNYHILDESGANDEDQQCAIQACVFWCYYLDKVLGSLLMKPPSLPKLRADPLIFIHLDDSSGSLSPVVNFMGKMARILEKAHELHTQPRNTEMINALIQDTYSLGDEIDKVRLPDVYLQLFELIR